MGGPHDTHGSAPAPPPTILIVDDHADLRESLAEILQFEGYSAALAGNGKEAIDYLSRNEPPNLILLDLKMPVMDGWEFRACQQQKPAWAGIPVAVLSGADATEQRAAGLDAVGYFVKPVNLRNLLEFVSRYCRTNGAGPTGPGAAAGDR